MIRNTIIIKLEINEEINCIIDCTLHKIHFLQVICAFCAFQFVLLFSEKHKRIYLPYLNKKFVKLEGTVSKTFLGNAKCAFITLSCVPFN